MNGLIRRFFPKGTDFDTISEEEIAYVENWIKGLIFPVYCFNTILKVKRKRPMKILNYMTPKQNFQQLSVAIAS